MTALQSQAWKALERKICAMWGGKRSGPLGEDCSDCLGGRELPVSIEVTRSKNRRIRADKVKQARRHGAAEGKPFVLVVADHNDREPIALCDHRWLVNLAVAAGLVPIYLDEKQLAKFESLITKGADCWEWQGYKDSSGYGRIEFNTRRWAAHRVSYMVFRGEPIPPELQIDHLCRNRACVNPDHLEVVTRSENVLRGDLAQRRRTHCPQGHPYDEENTYRNAGRRHCRTCALARSRKYRAKLTLAKAA